MAAPLNVFSHRVDPQGVLALLREAGPVEVVSGPGGWSSATLRVGKFLSRKKLTVHHDPDYYAGPEWPDQRRGMVNYFRQFDERPEITALIRSFRFCVSMPGAPVPEDPSHPIHATIRRIIEHLDGVLFLPGVLLDAGCRVLSAPEEQLLDAEAVMPAVPVSSEADELDDHGDDHDDDDDDEPNPPEARRVAERAMVLAGLSACGLAAKHPRNPDLAALRDDVAGWLEAIGAADELEPRERAYIDKGGISDQQNINAVWRSEGLAILGWALGWWERPRYDELCDPPQLWTAAGVGDPERSRALVEKASLRSEAELHEARTHALMAHWRLRNQRVSPGPVDFVALSKECWFGSFSLDGYEIVDGDLAIAGVPVNEASADEQSRVNSISMERHLAANWLCGDAEMYSDVDTST